jgi:glucose-1-phosphate thymidylyltransferase
MSVWGIVPAAGMGSRIQPLAFSKELLPVGSSYEGGRERPKAVAEYLVERMVEAGATRICMTIAPGKSDLVEYFGSCAGPAHVCYVVQPEPQGLCDALFRALPLLRAGDQLLVGLPDTVWFPADGFCRLPADGLSLLLFPVARPELFDAVLTDEDGRVVEIQVKRPGATSSWVWGAFRLPAAVFQELHALWCERGRRDVYVGTLINEWLARGGAARGVRAGESYVDVGTLDGYREALLLLKGREAEAAASRTESRGSSGAALCEARPR